MGDSFRPSLLSTHYFILDTNRHKKMIRRLVFRFLTLLVISNSVTSYVSQNNPYPLIDYANQSPWGTSEVSISHTDIDIDLLAKKNVLLQIAIIGVVARRMMDSFHTTSLKRELGDFDEFNQLLKGVVLNLPDINEVNAGTFLLADLILWVRNMKCFDISVEDIIINHGPFGTKEYDLSVDVVDLAISCDLDWRYVVFLRVITLHTASVTLFEIQDFSRIIFSLFPQRYAYSIFSGEGSAQVYTTKSDAAVTLTFRSIHFDIHPPSEVVARKCSTAIEIDTMNIQGGIVACKFSMSFQVAIHDSSTKFQNALHI